MNRPLSPDRRRWNTPGVRVTDDHAARQGLSDGLSIVVAYIPFSLALGAAMSATGSNPLILWSSSALIFAGSAQLAAVRLLDAGALVGIVVLTALVINARHLLYSASMAPHTAGWSVGWRLLCGYLLVDPVYALAVARFERRGQTESASQRRRYYFSAGLTCWIGWQVLTGAGVVLADALPAELPLESAAPLTFLLLVLPMLTERPAYVAALVGGAVSTLAAGLPMGLGLLLGAVSGVTAASFIGVRDA